MYVVVFQAITQTKICSMIEVSVDFKFAVLHSTTENAKLKFPQKSDMVFLDVGCILKKIVKRF